MKKQEMTREKIKKRCEQVDEMSKIREQTHRKRKRLFGRLYSYSGGAGVSETSWIGRQKVRKQDGGGKMTRFELLKRLEINFASKIIFEIVQDCKTQEELCNYLNEKISEKEPQRINEATLEEGRQPLFFSLKQ